MSKAKTISALEVGVDKMQPPLHFRPVPLDKVTDPEVKKWRTVTYRTSLESEDDEDEDYEFRSFGTAKEVHRRVLERLHKYTGDDFKTFDAFLDFLQHDTDGYGGIEYQRQIRKSVESIRIADTCLHCYR